MNQAIGSFRVVSSTVKVRLLRKLPREVLEELRLKADTAPLSYAGTLTNDDGISARYIFAVFAPEARPQATEEVAQFRWVSEDDVPKGPNNGHILSAVNLARNVYAES